MNKKILSVLICVLILLSSFSIISFATEVTSSIEKVGETEAVPNGNAEFPVFNNLFYTVIPKGYPICYDDHYSFLTEKNNDILCIDFYTFVNASDASVADIPDKSVKEFSENVLKKIFTENEEYEDVEAKKTTVNGCNAILINCEYDNLEDEEANDSIYVLTTKEVIFAIRFESYYGFPEDDVNKILDTFCMNGTHFEADKETASMDFSNAPDITEQLKKDNDNYDKDVYGTLDIDEEFSEEGAETLFIVAAVLLSVPTLVVTVLAIVFIVKYVKKKKKINEFESYANNSFNNNNFNNYNNF